MDGLKVAWCGFIAAHKFLFWSVIEAVTRSIYWYKEAAREQLVLKPRKPKDLYDNGYAIFAYDMAVDGWRGYWRTAAHTPGMAPEEMFEIPLSAWGVVPFHEVEFSSMPEISFKVRAVALEWCREHLPKPSEVKYPEIGLPRMASPEEQAQADVATKH